jgi:hypothetical protein
MKTMSSNPRMRERERGRERNRGREGGREREKERKNLRETQIFLKSPTRCLNFPPAK